MNDPFKLYGPTMAMLKEKKTQLINKMVDDYCISSRINQQTANQLNLVRRAIERRNRIHPTTITLRLP